MAFCSADAFAIIPFFFEYDNVGFESFPFAVQFVCGLQEMGARRLVGRQGEGLVFVMLRVRRRPRGIKKAAAFFAQRPPFVLKVTPSRRNLM